MDAGGTSGPWRRGLVGLPGGGSGERDEIELAHRATEELRAAATLMADAQRIANFGSWEWRLAENKVIWSDQLYRIFGVEPESFEATFDAYTERLHPEDREMVTATIERALADRVPYRFEHRAVRPDGSLRSLRCHGEPLLDAHGEVVRMVGVCQDVTELAASEHARAEADARFRSAFENAPIGVALVDFSEGPDGRLTEVNRALQELTGRADGDLVGSTLSDLCLPENSADDLPMRERLLAGEIERVSVEKRCLVDGERIVWLQLNLSVVRSPEGDVIHGIVQAQDVTERKEFEEQLRYIADHDSLTGLLNRRRFSEELDSRLAYNRRYGGTGAVLVVDVDGLKHINDTHGHVTGDAVLRAVADAIRGRIRSTDAAARLAGDEFAVMLPNSALRESRSVGQDLLARLAEHDVAGWGVAASIGVCIFDPEHSGTAEQVIGAADAAMYRAKQQGGATVAVSDADWIEAATAPRRSMRERSAAMSERVKAEPAAPVDAGSTPEPVPVAESAESAVSSRRIAEVLSAPLAQPQSPPASPEPAASEPPMTNGDDLRRRIDAAVRAESLLLYAQPVIDLRSNAIAHYEVLVRMIGEDGSVISASGFLGAAAQQDGLCARIDSWVVATVARLIDARRTPGPRFQINLSGETLASDDALDALAREIGESPIDPGEIAFEVGQAALDRDLARASGALGKLASTGAALVLDGFTAGFGSFDYLQTLPIDQIKMDGSVVRALSGDDPDHATVRAIVGLAHSNHRSTVAKLVDSEDLLPLLRMHGVDMAQGFEVGEPVPIANVV